jgi:phenylalanyl-tRNA synthetase beta chain
MNIAYTWLLDYVKTNLTPIQLGDKFRMTSSELEGIEDWSAKFKGLLIGKVVSVRPHPNANRLRIAEVETGSVTRTIVCGAPNLAEGQTVIVATPGTTIHPVKGSALTIEEAVIRGEKSAGMLCAAEEIGIPIPSEGIWVLPSECKSGSSFAEAVGLSDSVLDLEITPNRPDLLSYIGLAREVAAFEKKHISEPVISSLEGSANQHDLQLSVTIEDSAACLRYVALGLENITIQPSPLWMQSRLILSGIKPINNVVDVTNYCMLEYGQPLHAFDANETKGGAIHVRPATNNEEITLLDHSKRALHVGDIVIANDQNKAIALAGIMGGLESGIKETTTRIILESAVFNGPQIRRTSRRLGLRSEASMRFEKGLDPELAITALKRAVYLLQENGGAEIASNLVDSYPRGRQERPRIHLSFTQIQQLIGVHLSAADCKSILQKLGFQIPSLTKSSFEAVPPSWRRDVTLPEDVIEELIRIWGYDRLPSTMPMGMVKPPLPNTSFVSKSTIRKTLASSGLHECVHLSFCSADQLQKVNLDPELAVKLSLPLSQETEYLLPSHLLSLIQSVSGPNNRFTETGLFELGHIFSSPKTEQEMVSVLMRSSKQPELLYREAKTLISRLINVLRLGDTYTDYTEPTSQTKPYYATNSCTSISVKGHVVGELGVIAPEIVTRHKIRAGKHLVYFQINLDLILTLGKNQIIHQPASAFPAIERDITIICNQELPAADISKAVDSVKDTAILSQWYISNIYTGKPLLDNQKSITLHFIYTAPDRTLEDSEVTTDQERISQSLKPYHASNPS